MNHKSVVKISNIIGLIAITLLVYWVFIFITITVFGLKIFKQNLTETFYLSVIAILALMFGALIINIMFNLTRIAEKHNQDNKVTKTPSYKRLGILLVCSFPVLFGLLMAGDYLSAAKKEKMLISSAKSIVEKNKTKADQLLQYTFDEKWIIAADEVLDIYALTDKNFPDVSIIVADSMSDSKLFLEFRDYYGNTGDTILPIKKNFILKTTEVERNYLNAVFYQNTKAIRFSAHDGHYELFYPYFKNGKKIVLYFSDFQRYGKVESY